MRLLLKCAMLASTLLPSSMVLAQAAFIEGHVFNKMTGIPLSGAVVRVVENVTTGPIGQELASGLTDENGFYQFEVNRFLGAPAIIQIACETPHGVVRGGSSARLRDGVIRRDVYLGASPNLMRCREPK